MISFKNVSLQRGLKPLFHELNCNIYAQQKVGLVGQNGVGKSSLFMLLNHDLQVDSGELEIAKGTRIVTVIQEVDELELNVIDYVIKGHSALHLIRQKMIKAIADEAYEQHARLHGDFEALGGYQLETKAAQLLSGLGFSADKFKQPVSALSGGWRIRLNLAQALMQEADLLLLDEPTNHLDLDAVIWLEKYLQSYSGAIILISHDRIFLDNIIEKTCHIENQKIALYSGNYSSFEKQYHQQRELQQKTQQKQQQKIEHLQSFINRFKAKASKAKQAQSRVKMLEKMQHIEAVSTQQTLTFSFENTKHLPSGALLNLENASCGYHPQNTILNNITLSLLSDMRIGLLGKNGAGKSTLIKSLIGQLTLIRGDISRHPDLRIGYFAQHSLDALDLNASPLLHLQRLDEKLTPEGARKFLGRFNFSNDMALTTIKDFSGGEKARLALALIVYQQPNLLLLDEPTNHLDISVREALAYALQSFSGALILISHDRFLLESTVDEYWLVDNGQVQAFNGSLADYYQILSKKPDDTIIIDKEKTFDNKKKDSQARAQLRQRVKPIRNQIKRIEQQISKTQASIDSLEQLLQEQSLYADKQKLNETMNAHNALKKQLQEDETKWLTLNEELDAIQSKNVE